MTRLGDYINELIDQSLSTDQFPSKELIMSAAGELAVFKAQLGMRDATNASLCSEINQLEIELEAMFQALVSVLGDDEHRGHTMERTLELCRKTVYAYITAHPAQKWTDPSSASLSKNVEGKE